MTELKKEKKRILNNIFKKKKAKKMKNNSTYKFFLSCALAAASLTMATAQNDSAIIKKDITIEKEYTPSIKDAGKINDLPSIKEPVLKPTEVKYSDYSVALDPEYKVRQLDAARLRIPENNQEKKGFLRLGFGNYLGTLGDLVLPIIQKPKYGLDLNVNHKGIFDGHDGNQHHKSDASINFDRFFKEGKLFVNGGYSYRGFNYYGENKLFKDTLYSIENGTMKGKDFFYGNMGIHTWSAAAGYKSYPDNDLVNSLSASIAYDGFMPNEGLTQHRINTNIAYKRSVTSDNWGVGFNMQNYIFGDKNLDQTYSKEEGFTLVNFNPYYQFMRDRWDLRLGVNLNISTSGRAFAPTPDVKGTVTIVRNTLFFYAGLEGDYNTNSMSDMVDMCHYINLNEKVKSTWTPLDLKAGFKIKILYNLLTDLSIEYRMIKDQYFLVSDSANNATLGKVATNVFTPIYTDANVFTANFRTTYDYNNILNFLLSAKYHKWYADLEKDDMKAYNMPNFEFNFATMLKMGKHMAADLGLYIATGREALRVDGTTRKLSPIYDLNLGFYYNYNSKLSLFLKLNNILHRHYEQWYCYEVNGINGLVGLTYSF